MNETTTKTTALAPAGQPAQPGQAPPRKRRVEAQTKYAVYSLLDTLAVAQAIHQRGGGEASVDELAAFLEYRSSNNGAFYDRLSAARMFGLIQGQGSKITLTHRATEMLMPVFPEQAAKARVDAFLSVPLFGALYEEFKGKQLPPEQGLKNLLRTRYGVPPSRIVAAYGSLIKSADQAGFFATRGTKTQLILPRIDQVIGGLQGGPRADEDLDEDGEGNGLDAGRGDRGGGGATGAAGERGGAARQPASMDDLKARYISTLIEMLNKKAEPDPDLMAKIEDLLGFGKGQG
jgi:hypothetical protein